MHTLLNCLRVGVELGVPEHHYHAAPQFLAAIPEHFSPDVKAVFNYRMSFPKIERAGLNNCILQFKFYANLFANSKLIGTCDIDVRKYVEQVARNDPYAWKRVCRAGCKSNQRVTLPMKALGSEDTAAEDADIEGGASAEENVGEVEFELKILMQTEANQKKGGTAFFSVREPNEDPILVTPTAGRPGWENVVGGFALREFSGLGFMKNVLPVIIFLLLALVLMKWIGLL